MFLLWIFICHASQYVKMYAHRAIILMYYGYNKILPCTVPLSPQELRASKTREAKLEKALHKSSLAKSHLSQLEQESSATCSQYIRTLSSLEHTLQQELVAMDELEAQLTVERSAARAHLERAQTEILSLQREVKLEGIMIRGL